VLTQRGVPDSLVGDLPQRGSEVLVDVGIQRQHRAAVRGQMPGEQGGERGLTRATLPDERDLHEWHLPVKS
jgi:hypothetical protein